MQGNWAALLQDALDREPATSTNRRATEAPDEDARARRARRLAHLGELSAARQALTAAPLAPTTDATFDQLADPTRRPREPHEAIDPELLTWNPSSPVQLDRAALLTNLRRARKGAAPAPSEFTATQAFADVASLLAQAQARVPDVIRAALGLGRMVALRKPTGGTRGLVVGDFLRRFTARTLAQQFAPSLEAACRPHQ